MLIYTDIFLFFYRNTYTHGEIHLLKKFSNSKPRNK